MIRLLNERTSNSSLLVRRVHGRVLRHEHPLRGEPPAQLERLESLRHFLTKHTKMSLSESDDQIKAALEQLQLTLGNQLALPNAAPIVNLFRQYGIEIET